MYGTSSPITVLVVVGCLTSAWSFTLNVPNVLLPKKLLNHPATNFTLIADTGCFTWLSTKELVVTIKPEEKISEQGCSRKASLTALGEDTDRQLSIILASETYTGSELRVDVFVDIIRRITIKTTSLELLLEETPATFEVVAYDDDGNTFSTLEGLEFEWWLDSENGGKVVKIVKYADSSYLTPPNIEHLESMGKQGDKILVTGVNTGVAYIKTRLTHPLYKEVKEASVRVVVTENIMLNPPYDIWVLPLTEITYTAERRQHGRKTEIELPSDQYSIKISNATVANISVRTVTSLMVGNTDVMLIDKNVQHLPLGTPPHTTIHVVPPSDLSFHTHNNNWNLEEGKDYEVVIKVLGPENRPIKFLDSVRIKVTAEPGHVTILSSNVQGTHHVIHAKKAGNTRLNALLDVLVHPTTGVEHKLNPPILGKQNLVIRSPITLVPKTVILPYYPKEPFTYRLTASGGSGRYTWNSKDLTTVTVKDGEVVGKGKGVTMVTAADMLNNNNTASAEVKVVELSGLSFLPAKVEAILGATLRLNLAAYFEDISSPNKVPFTRCDLVPIQYTLSNDLFVKVAQEKPKNEGNLDNGVCSVVTVKAVRPGNTIVRATYTSTNGMVYSATITIAAYPPLTLIHPTQPPIITLGSSYVLTLSGGPQPWILDKSGYLQDLTHAGGYISEHVSENTKAKSAAPKGFGVSHNFRVTCTEIGEKKGLVMISNTQSTHNPFPAMETLAVYIRCEVPATLTLTHTVPLGHSCTLKQVPVFKDQETKLVYSVETPDSQRFHNSSSLLFRFKSSNNNRISLVSETVSGIEGSGSDERVHVQSEKGDVTITLTVSGYDPGYLDKAHLSHDNKLDKALEQVITFKVVGKVDLQPKHITMFNYEDREYQITVIDGSGEYRIETDKHDVIKITSPLHISPFHVKPVSQGITSLHVIDTCLPGQRVSAKIHVTGPASVVIETVSKVQIYRSVILTLYIVDSNERKISSEVFSKLDLSHVVSHDHVTLSAIPRDDEASPCDTYCSAYRVEGRTLGLSTIQFSLKQPSGKILSSNVASVYVFAPLKLTPSPITLVEGAQFQLRYSGGPPHDNTLEFSSQNTTTATITPRALVTGSHVGVVDVIGRSVGMGADRDIIYCQDSVKVHVVPLTGIELRAPYTFLIQNSFVPLTVYGINGNEPFTFGSVPGISFTWSVNSRSLSLLSIYDKSEYSANDEKQFVVIGRGDNDGVATVTVVATYRDMDNRPITYRDTITLQVVKKAELIAPTAPDLLLGVTASYTVKTNKDHTNTVRYALVDGYNVIDITSDGTVTALSVGRSTVRIDVVEDKNVNQTINLNVEVKVPFALLIRDTTVTPLSEYSYHTVPLGASTSFDIGTVDEVGRQFHAIPKTSYHYVLNRLDIVSIGSVLSNNTLSVTGRHVGEVIVQIKSDDGLDGWVYVRVSAPVKIPTYTVLQRSTVCVPELLQSEPEPGKWESKDSNLVSYLGSGRISVGNGVGAVTLTKHVTFNTHSNVKIDVVKVEQVDLAEYKGLLSNIATPQTVTRVVIPVTVVTSKVLSPLSADCQGKPYQIKFECRSSHPDAVVAKADYQNAKPVCIIQAFSDKGAGNIKPYITVSAETAVSSPYYLNFSPRFRLSVNSVVFTESRSYVDIGVVEGDISTLQVIPSKDGVVKVIKTSTCLHITPTLATISQDGEQVTLTVSSTVTGQSEIVTVTLKSSSEPPAAISMELSYFATVVIPTAILGILVLLIILAIVQLTAASYRRLQINRTTDPLHPIQPYGTPSSPSQHSPFRPVSPSRLSVTPLYTRPQGTPGVG